MKALRINFSSMDTNKTVLQSRVYERNFLKQLANPNDYNINSISICFKDKQMSARYIEI